MPATLLRRLPANLHAEGLAPGVTPRVAVFGLVLLSVLWGHQWLMAQLTHWLRQPSQAPRPPASAASRPTVTWRLLPSPSPPPPLPAPTPPKAAPDAPQTVSATPATTTRTHTTPSLRPPADSRTDAPWAIDMAEQAVPSSPPAAEPQAPTPWSDAGALQAPPIYPTRIPPATTLRFLVQRGTQHGVGEWRWQPADGRFQTALWAELGGQAWLDQHSQGALDTAGLAPERLVERQRGRNARAVNFQRDKALVSFSGSTRSWPLWAGTQDRLSWLPQLLAVVGGRTGWQAGDVVALATASPRGELALWQWQLVDRQSPAGDRETLHWIREPERPYDHRIDLWLSPQAPHWPWGWRWQVLPGGEPVLWWREEAPMSP